MSTSSWINPSATKSHIDCSRSFFASISLSRVDTLMSLVFASFIWIWDSPSLWSWNNCFSLQSSCNLTYHSRNLSSSALKIILSFFVSQIDWLKVSTLNIGCRRCLSFTTWVLLHFKTEIFEADGLLLFPFDKADNKDAMSSLPFVGSGSDKGK